MANGFCTSPPAGPDLPFFQHVMVISRRLQIDKAQGTGSA